MKISKQSVELIDHMGDDLSVVNAARVSFAKESKWEVSLTQTSVHFEEEKPQETEFTFKHLSDKDAKLIHYLAKHSHWTPFAHCFVSFRIKAPIFVARQLVKHQVGFAWNEVSRRYVQDEPEFYIPDNWRKAPKESIKQGSGGNLNEDNALNADGFWHNATTQALISYNNLLKIGVAPEQARMVLPQNTMTEWIWSGSLAAFSRVCKLRLDPHAQAETQEVAKLIQEQIQPLFPVSWEALQGVK